MQYYNYNTPNNIPPNGPYSPIQPGPPMSSQTQNTFVWIQGEDAARSYPVAPGNTVVLIDSDKPIMYMKTTDLSGRPQQMEVRYLVSKEDYDKIQNGGITSPNPSDYVTKETFEKYIAEAANKFALKRRDK